MSQPAPFRIDEAVTQISREATFGTAGTPVRAFPIAGLDPPKVTRPVLDVTRQSVHLYDEMDPVFGPKQGTFKLPFYLAPDGTQLASGASAVDHDLRKMLLAAFGGETAAAGSTVATPTSTTALTVAAGHGTRFAVGQWLLVQVGGVLEPTRVSAIATDDLSFDVALSAAPDSSGLVVNMYNNYPTPGSTESLYIDHALANAYATDQWALPGCMVSALAFKTDRNGIITAEFDLQCGSYTYPGSNISSVTIGTNTASPPWVAKDSVCLLQPFGALTHTQYNIIGASYKISTGYEYVPSMAGIDGKGGVIRTSARAFAEATIKVSSDSTIFSSWYNNTTSLEFIQMIPRGSALTKQWTVFDLSKCIIRDAPVTSKDGGRAITEFTLRSKMPSTATSGATDLARAPFRIARG